MSAPHLTYRIYRFDAERRILTADWLRAVDDADAIARAHATGFGSKCELWDGRRMVAQLEQGMQA